MTQSLISDAPNTKRSLPIAGKKNETLDVDAELARFEHEERARLGLATEEQWVEKMANLMFTKKEKGKIRHIGLTENPINDFTNAMLKRALHDL